MNEQLTHMASQVTAGKLTRREIVRRTTSSPLVNTITVGSAEFPIQIEVSIIVPITPKAFCLDESVLLIIAFLWLCLNV